MEAMVITTVVQAILARLWAKAATAHGHVQLLRHGDRGAQVLPGLSMRLAKARVAVGDLSPRWQLLKFLQQLMRKSQTSSIATGTRCLRKVSARKRPEEDYGIGALEVSEDAVDGLMESVAVLRFNNNHR
mmetsp:Transcript_82692/g.149161  ORF Transcript_82692/g.149161 Transcript_82692/m.149161 type:complete len:130 (+) Transcript_82692:160-549(+)|eukprot:CAMPEP_0115166710 /NCGR_PEP_ID=MMETSP0227-20121206/74264_1 /TAXON_ID=89957 /ORGANISM="Polarella glacialis, Strain CCMP 1383" /LENGTH=129 /DNA_ID=CAMNT_0002579253 /DNA_START=157 /DNA_END=546 /DNA_ORIENTATION=+